jgi:succinyl-diaminopimelate desuccinylase
VLLFDLDEHTGAFTGIKRYLETVPDRLPAGAFIGYPGNDRIVIGGRGFTRARVRVHGVAAHSGSHSQQGVNAIARAAPVIAALSECALPE